MSFEFLMQSIAEGFLVVFIIFGLIFEKRLIKFEKKLYIYTKWAIKKISAHVANRLSYIGNEKKLQERVSIYKNTMR